MQSGSVKEALSTTSWRSGDLCAYFHADFCTLAVIVNSFIEVRYAGYRELMVGTLIAHSKVDMEATTGLQEKHRTGLCMQACVSCRAYETPAARMRFTTAFAKLRLSPGL
jgi:hypothetical protein